MERIPEGSILICLMDAFFRLDLMQQLTRGQGITFLFSTHDPLVMSRATRNVRLHDGRVVADVAKPAA